MVRRRAPPIPPRRILEYAEMALENAGLLDDRRTDMAFWDEYEPEDDLPGFVTEEEKKDIVESQTRLLVTKVRKGETEFGPRWFIDVLIGGKRGEMRTLGFTADGSTEFRDRMLSSMGDYLERAEEGEVIPVLLVKKGRTFTFVETK